MCAPLVANVDIGGEISRVVRKSWKRSATAIVMKSKLRTLPLSKSLTQTRLFKREVSHAPTWLQADTWRRSPHFYRWNWECHWTCGCPWHPLKARPCEKQLFCRMGWIRIQCKARCVYMDIYYQWCYVDSNHFHVWPRSWKVAAYHRPRPKKIC